MTPPFLPVPEEGTGGNISSPSSSSISETYLITHFIDNEGEKFLIRLSEGSEPVPGNLQKPVGQFTLQNQRREKLEETIKECIAEKGLCVLINKGGMYILETYKSEKEMYCVWKLPKEGSYAIETDGSFKEKQKAGSSAFLIRDCTGLVVYAGRLVSKEYKSSIEYEAAGILNGVKQALKMGFKRVEVRSDCKSLVEAINGTSSVPKNVAQIIGSINEEKKNFESIEFHFVHRSVNRVADFLSHFKKGDINEDEEKREKEWLQPENLPKSVIYYCEQDKKGTPQKKRRKRK